MESEVTKQVQEILKRVAPTDMAAIERIVRELRTKVTLEPGKDFWEGKTPCWEMFRCPEMIKNDCPAPKYQHLPCWEIEGTYCKLYDYGAKGDDTSICQVCRVYKKWGKNEPIKLKLLGKGINTYVKSLQKTPEGDKEGMEIRRKAGTK